MNRIPPPPDAGVGRPVGDERPADPARPVGERAGSVTGSDLLAADHAVSCLVGLVLGLAVSSGGRIDEAGVCLQTTPGHMVTSNATSETVRDLDRLQCTGHEGPSVEAIRTARPVHLSVPDGRWPTFEARAGAAGLRSVWCVPLRWNDRSLGALGLYSRDPDVWTGPEVATVADRAAPLLCALLTAFDVQRTNENLRIALVSRDLIGQAKGVLMARQGISSDEAFALLRRASQRSNRKLRDIAQDIVVRARPG